MTQSWLDHVRSVWDDRAESWDEMSEANAVAPDRADDLRRTAAALQMKPGSVVLDAGCGTGQFATAFAAMGCRVTAFDLAPEMIARAQEHAAERGVAIDWRIGDIGTIADPLAVYDAIHARMVLLFAADVPAALREFRRVLRPGGRLYASVPGALSPIYSRSWRRLVAPENVGTNFMVPWELAALLHDTGWSIVDQWGEFGPSLTGETNTLTPAAAAALPFPLQQAAATSWTFIAT